MKVKGVKNMAVTKAVKYVNPPEMCDLCGRTIQNDFVDGRIKSGHWANMCFRCYEENGVGLGTGKGQHYVKGHNGNFIKMEG